MKEFKDKIRLDPLIEGDAPESIGQPEWIKIDGKDFDELPPEFFTAKRCLLCGAFSGTHFYDCERTGEQP